MANLFEMNVLRVILAEVMMDVGAPISIWRKVQLLNLSAKHLQTCASCCPRFRSKPRTRVELLPNHG